MFIINFMIFMILIFSVVSLVVVSIKSAAKSKDNFKDNRSNDSLSKQKQTKYERMIDVLDNKIDLSNLSQFNLDKLKKEFSNVKDVPKTKVHDDEGKECDENHELMSSGEYIHQRGNEKESDAVNHESRYAEYQSQKTGSLEYEEIDRSIHYMPELQVIKDRTKPIYKRSDIVNGIIFSEIINKPKAFRK